MAFALDYDEWIHLDAEDLAEGGIGRAYERLLPRLKKYVKQPLVVKELLDNDTPSYSVRWGDENFTIYSPEIEETTNSWGLATVAFFRIVNDQLKGTEVRLYAINGGNDLGGMFLTPAQAKAAQKSLENRRDWPYLPKNEEEWFGQYH